MNRLNFYGLCLSGAIGMGLLVGSPICRPVFGEILGANRDQEKREKEIKILMAGGTIDPHHHDDHHDNHGHGHGKIKGHH
ncbi:hypothetical protein RB653_003168 [Dictyostelium firmibasis]|uniref:Uncharacterized protein n=1 Tax=Dictyostelium firmibasis TaxID=79012 RepID=A0AAN7TZH0_9MYCE